MKKNILAICVLCTLIFSSCKNEPKPTEEVATKKTENVIVLSNYSDTNWKSGVAIELYMFLMDNTKENLEKIKNAKKLTFADGTFATVTGYKEDGKFIQILLAEKASTFMTQASYPFEITVE